MKRFLQFLHNPYVYSLFTKICGVVIGLVYSILLSRYLGAALKGQWTYISTITSVTVIVGSMGIHQAYPYYKKQGQKDITRVFVNCIIELFLILTVLSLVVGVFFHANWKVLVAVLVTPIMIYAKLITYVVMIENPNRRNRWEFYTEIIEVLILAIMYWFVKASIGVIIALLVLKSVASSVYFTISIKEKIHFQSEDFKLLKKTIVFGFFPMLSLLMNDLNYRVDVLMLEKRVSDIEIGIYSIGVHLAEKIWLVSEAVRDVLYSKLVKGKDSEEVNKVLRLCITACLVIVLFILLLGKWFIGFCYGNEYITAYEPMAIILFGALVMVYYKVIQAYNIVQKRQKRNFVFLMISVATNVVMNLLFIPRYSINGAALASLISYSICSLIFVVDYLIYTKSRVRDIVFIQKKDILMLSSLVKSKKEA